MVQKYRLNNYELLSMNYEGVQLSMNFKIMNYEHFSFVYPTDFILHNYKSQLTYEKSFRHKRTKFSICIRGSEGHDRDKQIQK